MLEKIEVLFTEQYVRHWLSATQQDRQKLSKSIAGRELLVIFKDFMSYKEILSSLFKLFGPQVPAK